MEIMITRCQRATIITNINVKNTNSHFKNIFGTRPTKNIELICGNRFDNIKNRTTSFLLGRYP